MSALSVCAAASDVPDRVALAGLEGPLLTYAALAERVRKTVAALLHQGVRPGDTEARVAFVADRTADTVTLLFALLELGAPAVPLHPRLTEGERRELLRRFRPFVVVDSPLTELWGRFPADDDGPVLGPVDPQNAAVIVTSSGTTGTPRGVVLSRGALEAAAVASAAHLGVHDDDRWLLAMPPAHVGGLSIPIRTLVARRTTVLLPPGPFEPRAFVRAIERDRVTLASVVPTMLVRLLDEVPDARALDSLRALLVGGAAAPPSLLGRARARGFPVLATYGLTESSAQVATEPLDAAREDRGDQPPRLRPLPGIALRIEEGQILVRGPTLLSGLYPPHTGDDPLRADGWLPTGDLGRLDADGDLQVLGRADDRIITGGENVDPAEVEAALTELPGVAAACVVGVPDATWGAVVVAALVPERGAPRDAEALLFSAAGSLAPHKRPRRIVWVDALPRTPSGKLMRARLRKCLTPGEATDTIRERTGR